MLYDVHIYIGARYTVKGVEAEDQVSAIKKAEEGLDFDLIVKSGQAEFDDEIDSYLVDEQGATEYRNTHSYNYDYERVG